MSAQAETLKLAMVQSRLFWEQKAQNLNMFEERIQPLKDAVDVIVLPEMFSTGFSMNAKALADTEDGIAVEWMKDNAQRLNAVITGSLIIKDGEHYFNRLFWVRPDGSHETYNKKHLFSFANEEEHYSPGTERIIVEHKGWRICPLICYDLRFPVWSRNNLPGEQAVDFAYDLLIYVANWPQARRKPWMNLLEARAHENQAYVIGVNRVGEDGNGIPHSGDSLCFSPKGELITGCKAGEEETKIAELSYADMQQFRSKFTAWKDKDNYRLL